MRMDIMKKIYCVLFMAAAVLTGCGGLNSHEDKEAAEAATITIESEKDEDGPVVQIADEKSSETDKETEPVAETENEADNAADVDFFEDHDKEIEADVNAAIGSASSLQDEIDSIQNVVAKYALMAAKAETQAEMNMASGWSYTIWDKELNSLWSRISNSADEKTKERLLADQRNWISMKEEVRSENIGSMEDGGSMYPMSENSFYEEITYNRVCILANELANQGTGDVYSSLITRTGMELDNEAIISIYRLGETEGTFREKGNGEYEFISYSENVKGIIRMNGWEGVSFEVTASVDSPFTVGEIFEFDYAF